MFWGMIHIVKWTIRIPTVVSLSMLARLATLLGFVLTVSAWAQDPEDLARRSISQDRLAWLSMNDYTWEASFVERFFDSHGKLESTKQRKWETMILYGQLYSRMMEQDG